MLGRKIKKLEALMKKEPDYIIHWIELYNTKTERDYILAGLKK